MLSPASVTSEECEKELEIALEAHKRIIPVVFKNVEPDGLPEALTTPNWIFLRDADDRGRGLDSLVHALDDDLAWRDLHTRLAGRATEWLTAGRDTSFLLRGTDLRQAEDWNAERARHSEQPTEAQDEYLRASRKAASRRQRRLLGAVGLALAVSLVLSVVALIQRSDARAEANRSQSIAMAEESTGDLSSNIPLALLLSVGARERADTSQAVTAMAEASTEPLASVTSDGSAVTGVAFSPKGSIVASGDEDQQVVLYDRTTKTTTTLDDGSAVNGIALSRDGSIVASGDQGGQVLLYDRTTKTTSTLDDDSVVTSVAFSPDGSIVASGDQDGQVVLYDRMSEKITKLDENLYLFSVAQDPRGSILAIGGETLAITGNGYGWIGQVILYDMTTRSTTTLHINSPVYSVAFSRDGSTLAIGNEAGQVALYNLRDKTTTTFDDGSAVRSVAFSPDGANVASGDDDGQVLLYNRATKTTIALDDGSVVTSVAFSPDGSILASGDVGGQVVIDDSILWSAPFPRLKQRLCDELGGTNMTQTEWAANVPDQPYQKVCS